MKLTKIKLALFAVSIITAHTAFALTQIVDETTTAGLLGTAGSSYSSAIGQDAVAGSGQSFGPTAFSSGGSATAWGTMAEEDLANSNTLNVAIGQGAEAGTGSDTVKSGSDLTTYNESEHGGTNTGTQYKYGHGSSVAVGADSYADWGGTAIGTEATASGRDSVGIGKEVMVTGHKAVGIGEDTVASGFRSTAVGNSSTATAKWSSAFGAEASASGENSVALGRGSIATRTNTVSVGSAGSERTISNVAAGVYGTDAVNLNQLQATEKKLSSGIAAAMAMTTPVILPGKSNAVALGVGYYNQAGAVSLNLAHKFSEEIVATASGSYGFNSQSTSVGSNNDFGARASLSYSF